MKSTKKSLALSTLSLLLCVAMLLGTTYAWFTDSVTSGVNQIVAGNLDIEVYHTNASTPTNEKVSGATNLFRDVNGNEIKWEPGVISYENFEVKNEGNLALKYKLAMNITDYNALNSHTLKEVLKVKVLTGENILSTVDRASVTALNWNTSDTLDVFQDTDSLEAGKSNYFQVIVYWEPTDNDNLYNVNNGQTTSDGEPLFVKFGINVVATQNTVENDSFDEQYDKDATYPVLAPIIDEKTVKTVSCDGAAVVIDDNTTIPAADETDDIQIKKSANTEDSSKEKNDYQMAANSSLAREIKTTESTADSVTYDISYVYTEGDTSYDVSEFASVVTNVIELSTGLKDVKVTHTHGSETTPMSKVESAEDEGNDGYYKYDSSTGKLTIWSSKYSSFAISYASDFVAAVAGQGYATLAEAINAAKANNTITLLQNCETGNYFGIIAEKADANPIVLDDDNVTLDLNGKTITVTHNFSFVIAGDNDIVKNGTIQAAEKKGNNNEYYRGYPLVVATLDAGTMAENVTVENVKILGGISAGGSVENNETVILGSGDVTLKNCTINTGSVWTLYAQIGSTLKVVSGTYDAGQSGLAYAEEGSTISITGGTYNVDPSEYVASSYKAYPDTILNVWRVEEMKPVVKNTTKSDKTYYTWEDALADASDGDTLVLLDTIYPTQNMTFDKTLVIDMDGHGFVREKESSGGYKINVKPGCDLTMKNGDWSMNATFGDITAEGKDGTCNITYENVNFINLNNPTTEEILAKPGNSSELSMNAFKGNFQGNFTVKATFTNCTFLNSKVEFSGFNSGNTFDATFDGCTFTNITNSEAIKADGYGMDTNCKLTVTNCIFNMTVTASVYGVEADRFNSYNNSALVLTLTNNTINGAIADSNGYVVNEWASAKLYSASATVTVNASGNEISGIATLN